VLVAGYAALRWADLAGADRSAEALVVAGCAAAAALLAAPVGRLVREGPETRVSVELAAATLGALAAALSASPASGPGAAALTLTVLGATTCLLAVLHADRAEASWLGTVLLGVATVVRVADEVPAPERWTLPAAALLLAAGAWRLHGNAAADSWRLLGSGLTLALLPSLLLALDEPVSLRGALVGTAGLLTLAVGVRTGWAAPFAAGAVTPAVLAIRHLGPVAEALPRWISLGTVGVVLLAVGVSWEARRRNLAATGRYLAGLR
jgi:hypothetical protein